MFVKDYMTRHPVMVEPTMPAVEAQGIMSETQVRHLPVIEAGKRFVGLLTRDRLRIHPAELGSLNVWEITRYLSNLAVKDVMIKGKEVVTIEPGATIEEAARIMVKNKVGCLPVLEEGIVVGIITEIDLLAQLTDLLGGTVAGVRVTVRVPDRIGEFAKVTCAIAAQGWGIYAAGCVPSPKAMGYWDAVFKVRHVPQEDLLAVLSKIEGQHIVDIREIVE